MSYEGFLVKVHFMWLYKKTGQAQCKYISIYQVCRVDRHLVYCTMHIVFCVISCMKLFLADW